MVEILIGSAAKKKIQQVSLSNDTIRPRIDSMAVDVCQKVCTEIKESTLQASIQFDKSTDTALESHLIAFVRYEKERKMKTEFLFCNTLSTTATAIDIKAVVEGFFEANELSWLNFKHICTDGAPAMVGAKGGFVTLVKNEWPRVTSSHCLLHRYALATKTLPTPLMEFMDVAVKVINFICARAKNHRLFQILAKEMGAKHLGLLYHTKVRWLSRGKCLSQLYELKGEVEIFLLENENNFHMEFRNTEFVIKLAYLADLFGHLNKMNVCLQGRDVTVSNVQDKLAGLSSRMSVWQARIKAGSTVSFPVLVDYLRMNRIEFPVGINTYIKDHLEALCAEFQSYFNYPPLYVSWHKNSFNIEVDAIAEEAEELRS